MNLRPGPATKATLIGTKGIAINAFRPSSMSAPASCHLIGLPMPENVEGGLVYEALEDPNWYQRS